MLNRSHLAIGIILLSALPIPEPASAQLTGYIPPPGRPRLQRTESSGSRGCNNTNNAPSINLITPSDHIGQTVSGHPTFLWNVSAKTSAPIRFTLVKPGVSQPIIQQLIKVEKPGIMQLKMPNSVPELTIGKEYRWTVEIICNSMRPSENLYARAWIVRVPQTTELAQKLKSRQLNPSQIYAQEGIWYDAIATSYTSYQTKYFFVLLSQIGLAKLATQTQQPLARD